MTRTKHPPTSRRSTHNSESKIHRQEDAQTTATAQWIEQTLGAAPEPLDGELDRCWRMLLEPPAPASARTSKDAPRFPKRQVA